MKTLLIMRINAIFLIASGIAFGLYGPLMMAFFSIPELQINSDIYWLIAAFVRMFGAALFGFGLLLWSLREAFSTFEIKTQRGILAALILGHLMGTFIAITQTVSIWGTAAGWILTALFGIFTVLYITAILLMSSNKPGEIELKEQEL